MENPARIVIECRCNVCHDWMAFASWYSFRKMLPDVSVAIRVRLHKPIFRWVSRFSSLCRGSSEGDMVIAPTVVAVREFLGDWSVSPAKSGIQTCLVDYSDGCGNFVVDDWINTNRHPFHKATMRFGTSVVTVNELAVFKLWEGCESLYRGAGV